MNGSGHVLVEIEREAGREAGSSSPVDLTNVAGQRKAGQGRCVHAVRAGNGVARRRAWRARSGKSTKAAHPYVECRDAAIM